MYIHTMSHDGPLALLSFMVALFASYTALDMGSRLRRAMGRSRTPWLIGSAVVLGSGIWSMHFLAMLAFRPGVPVAYDFHLTALSLIIAIVFAAIGFHLVARARASFVRLAVAGLVVGMGVTAMHYCGMAALILSGRLLFNPLLVGASFAVAVVAATAALWLTLNLTSPIQRVVAAIVMAVAVCGMHYTGMSATSLLCTPGLAGSADPASRTMLAVAVALAQFMVLCLAMVCVFADRRFELLAEREAERLRAANRALTVSQGAIRNLLDHADQGFLTIGPGLAVEEQCSAACERMLRTDPRGKPITALLCRDGAVNAGEFENTLNSLLRDTNDYMRELKLGLLPELFTLGATTLKVAYKYLADSQRLMLILTDITDTTLLTAAVERESRRLRMTVLALTEGETFSSLVDDYEKFLTEELPILLKLRKSPGLAGDLGRRLHTFKGLLAQFSFPESPARLHWLESELDRDAKLSMDAAQALKDALKQDLDSVAAVMGAGTGLSARRVAVSHHQIQEIRAAATAVMKGGADTPSPALQRLLQSVLHLGGLDVKSTIELHAKGAAALAERLEKELAPIQVHGDRVSLASDRFGEFLRSLVHVLRNSVDHGIEDPEERLQAGKAMEGHIDCVVSCADAMLEILIADDGRGIDRAALERKLESAGVPAEKRGGLSLEDLVFCEGLSSHDTANDVSGRGIGLAAVRAELDRLGGRVQVESWAGKGTRFTFTIPVTDESCVAKTQEMESTCP